jgi:hypothetical protein
MSFPPPKRVECCPKDMLNYALWCEMTWGPEPTPCEIVYWWCTPCRMVFPEQDEVRPQRCPVCDAEAAPSSFRLLPGPS